MPCFALSVSQRKDAYLVFLLHWMETITLTLLRKWAILTVLVLVPRQRTIVCVCAYVCPPFLHLKETPKEKLNNTLPLTKSIKQLCPHVFLDLKVLYLNSFQIMSKKKKKWCHCLCWQPQGALFISYYSNSFQGIFPVNIMKSQPYHRALLPLPHCLKG